MKLHRAKFTHLENLIAEWSQYVERMESEIRRLRSAGSLAEHFKIGALSSGQAAQTIWREIKAERKR
jgi:hypothetical protein